MGRGIVDVDVEGTTEAGNNDAGLSFAGRFRRGVVGGVMGSL